MLFVWSAVALLVSWGDGAATLTLAQAARRAVESAGDAQVALMRRRETEAVKVGAGLPAQSNPSLSIVAGPGFVDPGRPPDFEFMLSVSWPVEVSGAPGARRALAGARNDEADFDLRDALRRTVFEVCDLYIRTYGAKLYVALANDRSAVDTEVQRIAEARRRAGAVGDGDVALARVLLAEGAAQRVSAEGQHQAARIALANRLGFTSDTLPQLVDSAEPPPPPLDNLLSQLPNRPDVRRLQLAALTAQADVNLQQRAGWPVPQVSLAGGRGPEYQAQVGLLVPMPIYQRNQTARATSLARRGTANMEVNWMSRLAEAELRAAYTMFLTTQEAHATLLAAVTSINDAEHLAVRAYDLGQDSMATVMVARRESVTARRALLDARLARDRARLALGFAAGVLPGWENTSP